VGPVALSLCTEGEAELHLFDLPSSTVTEIGNWNYWLHVIGEEREWLGQPVVDDIGPSPVAFTAPSRREHSKTELRSYGYRPSPVRAKIDKGAVANDTDFDERMGDCRVAGTVLLPCFGWVWKTRNWRTRRFESRCLWSCTPATRNTTKPSDRTKFPHIDFNISEKSACLVLETKLFRPAVVGRHFDPDRYTSLASINTANTTPTSLTWMLKAEDTVEVGLSEQQHDDELAADMANPRTIAYRRSAMVPANELPGLDAAIPAKKPARGASRDHHSPVT